MVENIVSLLDSWGISKAAEQMEFLLNPSNIPFAVWETLYAPLLATVLACGVGRRLGRVRRRGAGRRAARRR